MKVNGGALNNSLRRNITNSIILQRGKKGSFLTMEKCNIESLQILGTLWRHV